MNKQNQVDAQHPSQSSSNQPVNPQQDKELLPSLPQERDRYQENGLWSLVYLSEVVEQRSHLLIPLLGYCLLVFALFDYIHIVIPLSFTNPVWELQTIGALVEHAPVSLLGLILVFYRDQGYVVKWEKNLLGFLSWFSLLVGLLYLLMLPLGITDTWRIYQSTNVQVAAKISQQRQQFQPIRGQLEQAETDQQIKQLVNSLVPQVARENIKNPQAVKNQFLTQISEAERKLEVQVSSEGDVQQQALLKNAVKWNLGALIAGTFLISIWHFTDWARNREY